MRDVGGVAECKNPANREGLRAFFSRVYLRKQEEQRMLS
jgi:hypothetical protein